MTESLSENPDLAWDLGDPGGQITTVTSFVQQIPVSFDMHPMKGPMTTQTLRGLKDLDPLHWRGDRNHFLEFNGTFRETLDPDLRALQIANHGDVSAARCSGRGGDHHHPSAAHA